jgi:tetratricopeptide (TPR) repeat protein
VLAQEVSAGTAEEAADFARRAALAALHGPQKIFQDSVDADGVLRHLLGNPVWLGLTNRQQEMLRTAVREYVVQALAPASGAASEVAWAWVPEASEGPIFVYLGLRYGAAVLKTRWTVQRTPRGWAIEDIVLVDPGLSLAGEVGRLLGPDPVRPRDRVREARARALPRLLGLLGVLGIALVFARRLPRERLTVLWLTASVPAALFVVDGVLAARRALLEQYALVEVLPQQDWRRFEKVALQEQHEGHIEQARSAWDKAVEAGAPRAAVYYQMGLSARSGGDIAEAEQDFERALSENPPAPGAGKELALIVLSRGRNAEARTRLQTYLRETGPDPETLATLAVVEINMGDTAAAVQTVVAARALIGESWKRAELEAQVYARSGNAAQTVASLRLLEGEGRLDRATLRADPSYLPIATDPAWISFLAEPPSAAVTPTPAH